MNEQTASAFINSLVKNLQVLCHSNVDFNQNIEVIGHLYLNIDSSKKINYIVNEKVCKNDNSSTMFVSNSFHAEDKQKKPNEKQTTPEQQIEPSRETQPPRRMSEYSGNHNTETSSGRTGYHSADHMQKHHHNRHKRSLSIDESNSSAKFTKRDSIYNPHINQNLFSPPSAHSSSSTSGSGPGSASVKTEKSIDLSCVKQEPGTRTNELSSPCVYSSQNQNKFFNNNHSSSNLYQRSNSSSSLHQQSSPKGSNSDTGQMLQPPDLANLMENSEIYPVGMIQNTALHNSLPSISSLTGSKFNQSSSSASAAAALLQDTKNEGELLKVAADMKSNSRAYNLKCSDMSDSDYPKNSKSDEELILPVSQLENKFDVKVEKTDDVKQFSDRVSESDLKSFSQSHLPVNSVAKSNWAFRTFTNWRLHRNSMKKEGARKFEQDILEMENKTLSESLAYFITEVKRQDGEEYRGDTIYELVVSLQYYMKTHGRIVNLLDGNDFIYMREVLDEKLKQLAQTGHGLKKKSADVITEEYEEFLWIKGILGSDTPKQLLDTVIYLLGLNFALRSGKDHRNLRFGERSQIQICGQPGDKDRYLLYTEDVSKSNQGRLNHRKISKKTLRAYENESNPERCPVLLYEKYLKFRPQNCKTDALYLEPKKCHSGNNWYNGCPVGIHTLQNVIKNLCSRAGLYVPPARQKGQRTDLKLDDKINLIMAAMSPSKPKQSVLAAQFGVSQPTISYILQRKDQYLAEYQEYQNRINTPTVTIDNINTEFDFNNL